MKKINPSHSAGRGIQERSDLPDCDWSYPWLSPRLCLLVLASQPTTTRMTCGCCQALVRHSTSPVASFGVFTTLLGHFGLYFTAAVGSFSKAEQEFLDHSSYHTLLSRPGEECSLKVKCLTFGLK